MNLNTMKQQYLKKPYLILHLTLKTHQIPQTEIRCLLRKAEIPSPVYLIHTFIRKYLTNPLVIGLVLLSLGFWFILGV